MKKKITLLLIMLMSLISIQVKAHSGTIRNGDGKTLYYKFVNSKTAVYITYRGDGNDQYTYSVYSGDINIPESITVDGTTYPVIGIYEQAFYQCTGLTSVIIPNSVTDIDDQAFSGCSSLNSVSIPNSVTYIGREAFAWCSSLNSVSIPNSVTYIGSYAFRGTGVTSFTIPNSVTSIGRDAFINSGWYNNQNNGLLYLDNWLLGYKGSKPTGDRTIIAGTKAIAESALYNCPDLTSITIPNSVTSIGAYAFDNCSGLTSITIPNSVTSIEGSVFYGCSGLTSVTIPNSVTSIGNAAFRKCGLTSVTIPNSVTSIADYAFSECDALTSVTVKRKSPITISSNVFSNYADATLYVPSVAAYEAAEVWTDFNVITEMSESFTMNNLGKSTYCSEYPLDFTNVSGIAAYIISGFDHSTGKLIRTRVYEVPERTGLFIIGTPGATYNIPVKETGFYYANMMKGITVAKVIPTYEDNCTNFILASNGNGGVYFTRSNGVGTTAANRAYVQIPTSIAGSRGFLDIEDDDSTTGLNGVFTPDTKEAEAVYYNLSGQKVQKPQKGIYIKNGKKIIIH